MVKLLNTSLDYYELPEFLTITIASYEPFGAGDMYYSANTVIITHSDISYDDGILHILIRFVRKQHKKQEQMMD